MPHRLFLDERERCRLVSSVAAAWRGCAARRAVRGGHCAQACAVVDKCLKELVDTVDELKGRWLVTSDHGNADDMVQRTKKGEPIFDEGKPVPLTSHTLAPVGVSIGGAGLPEGAKVRCCAT